MERRNHKIGKASVSLVIMGVAVAVPLTSVHGQTAPALSNANMTRTLNEQGVYSSLQEAVDAVRLDVRRENMVASGEPSFRAFNPAQQYDSVYAVGLEPCPA